ncbi:DNA-binding protein [Luteitalea sp. TBR-22]|uniref:helix-turn-helix domain-containing protein n=1 Tax=Luteitalea sp. TBR-22 TaxID=2802971 RepID=UPI001AF7B6B3|nr:helix-turn-helix domain-containing protein [Luteitalea sp. TBR-22]BCS33885.1 DNA-binding protein [Luteitalea sp. TBR-22]
MTVGERLREARERQKVTLHAIAEKTNISVRFLDAIEKNQYDKLPGGIFTRGFIRSYASLVGLDPDAAVAQFLADEPGQRDEPIDEVVSVESDGVGVGRILLGGLAAIALALVLAYLFKPEWLGLRAAGASPQDAAAPAVTPAAAAPEPLTSGPAPIATEPAAPAPAATTTLAVAPEATPAPEAPKAPLRLVVTPKGRCWVQVSADGTVRVAREIASGESVTVDASERLQIVVGDAGSFAYELNGRPGKALGAAGRVARATILPSTATQFQEP